ncbi:MAG: NUDIX domain-containing protein [Nanoarchaeota archaeon]
MSEYIEVVNGVLLQDKKVLLVRKKTGIVLLPGGKRNEGESDLDCLAREFSEELPGTIADFDRAMRYHEVIGTSPTSKKPIRATIYLVDFDKVGEPASEIVDKYWMNRVHIIMKKWEISAISYEALEAIMNRDYI